MSVPPPALPPGQLGGEQGPAERAVRSGTVAHQRRRVLAATVALVAEHGYAGLRMGSVSTRARVSRHTLREQFEDRGECFLAAYRQSLERISAVVLPAYVAEHDWVSRVRAGLAALLSFLDREPAVARLVIVEVYAAGEPALALRAEVLERLRDLLDGAGESPEQAPTLAAEALIGSVESIIHSRLSADSPRPLLELLGPLMQFLATPYLGAQAAARELERPRPALARLPAGPPAELSAEELLERVGMRPGHRTLQVLEIIAERPGLSNREIGLLAGAISEGQTSRLLARLAALGVIESTGARSSGGCHAWRIAGIRGA